MDAGFMARLEALRLEWGTPLTPTSGMRCEEWNRKVGGAPSSMHLKGRAADFFFSSPHVTRRFYQLCEKHGFGGIGRGDHLVHIDDRDEPARWTYDDKP
jgi:uncharacterized protein YcbK (DUF882 family)